MLRMCPKNHTLSRLIGPPIEKFTSQTLSSFDGDRRPASFSACVKLSLCIPSRAPMANRVPEKVFPPERGTMLIDAPPFSASARPPVRLTVTSAALLVSSAMSETPPVEPPVVIPSIRSRPSKALPPCPVKYGGTGP